MKKILLPLFLGAFVSFSQQEGLSVTGNVESTFQYLNEDTLIGAKQPAEKAVLNNYALVNFTYKNFKAGTRFESYLPHLLGYPDRYSGSGIGYRYAGYSTEQLDFTVGNFYEQFGNGMIFRSYEQRQLGIDNCMDGLNLRFRPVPGFEIKTVYGRMRYSFTNGSLVNDPGIVRGFDGYIDLANFYNLLAESKFKLGFGGSFVSKYQKANHAQYYMPQNVGSYGGRIDMKYSKFFLNAEYIIKENDPSVDNGFIYNNGHAAYVNLGYTQKGLGVILYAKSIDNMSFRTDPNAILTDLNINFLPALTKSHTENLAATLYPYATQPVGEVAFQADVFYKIPKETKIGGKYGTEININFATSYRPVRHVSTEHGIDLADSSRVVYKTGLFEKSDSLYYRDINIEIKRTLNKKWKVGAKYFHFNFNNNVNVVSKDAHGMIACNIGVIDIQYKINKKHSIRMELQGLWTSGDSTLVTRGSGANTSSYYIVNQRDKGDWFTFLLEYNISPKFYFAVMDQYNYGNPVESKRVHYLIGTAGYIFGASRISILYGKQREGIFCIGGVCRTVPATNGLTITFTTSF